MSYTHTHFSVAEIELKRLRKSKFTINIKFKPKSPS